MIYLKYVLFGIFFLNSVTWISAQDTLLLYDGEHLIVEVNRIDENRFYYKENDKAKSVLKKKVKEIKFSTGWKIDMTKGTPKKSDEQLLKDQRRPGNETYPHEKKKGYYLIRITSMYNSKYEKGYLRAIEDSLIVLWNYPNKFNSDYKTQNINVQNIKTIKIREDGKIRKGILFGILTGVVVGGIIGYASGDDCGPNEFLCFPREAMAIAGAAGMAIPGGLIGGIIGSVQIKIPINGDPKAIKARKEELLEYMIY